MVLNCQTQTAFMHKRLSYKQSFDREEQPRTLGFCQCYYYEDEPAKTDGADNRATDVALRKALVSDSLECFLFEKLASDVLTSDKHLLSGVTLCIGLRRSPNNFTVISESYKPYRVKIVEENL